MADRKYGFRVVWSDEDEAYLASCPEFPGVVAHGDTPEEAIAEARVALDLAIEMYEADGRSLPEARGVVEHSGQFRLRLPRTAHAQLVQRADEEGVSLNTYVATAIAAAVGRAQVETRAAAEFRAMLHEVRSTLKHEFGPAASWGAPVNEIPSAAETPATISFGLVSVPVNVYSSTVKGYEFTKDHYAVLTPEELKAVGQKATQMIEILEFVPLEKVDREYLEKVYYLGPGKGADRAYRLLAEALKETGKAGLGQYTARARQYLVLLRPRDGVLVMEQLHYADEVRPTSEVPVPAGEVMPQELKLAKQLIAQTANDEFEPQKYKDTVRERVLETIRRRVNWQDINAAEAPQDVGGKIIDLMEALRTSLRNPNRQREKKKVS
jgi:DNA end-binding protein Ku